MLTYAPDEPEAMIDVHVSGMAGPLAYLEAQKPDMSFSELRHEIVKKTGFENMFYFVAGTYKIPVNEEPTKTLQDLLSDSGKAILQITMVKDESCIEDIVRVKIMPLYPQYELEFRLDRLVYYDVEVLSFRFYDPAIPPRSRYESKFGNSHNIYFLYDTDPNKILGITSEFFRCCAETDQNKRVLPYR